MKKTIIAILMLATLMFGILAFAACDEEPKAQNEYTLVAPDGAPALALANVASTIDTQDKSYTLKKSVVSAGVISNEALKSDLAIVPANLAATIYNGGNDIRLLAVVTNGNLFVVSNMETEVKDLSELKGNLVYSIGQGSVPDMIFQSLLKKANIPYAQGEYAVAGRVIIKYFNDGSEVVPQMALAKKEGKNVFGVFAEPAVTNAVSKQGFVEVFNLQTLWADSVDSEYEGYAQAVLIAKTSVCEDKEFIANLLKAFSDNAEWVVNNPEQAVTNIKSIYEQSTLSAATLNETSVKRCNIKTVAMPEGKAYYEQMLNAVKEIKIGAIGGKLPDDNFYYAA